MILRSKYILYYLMLFVLTMGAFQVVERSLEDMTGRPMAAINIMTERQQRVETIWKQEVTTLWDFINHCQERMIQK